jgi:hypothetical protein
MILNHSSSVEAMKVYLGTFVSKGIGFITRYEFIAKYSHPLHSCSFYKFSSSIWPMALDSKY